MFTQLHWRIHIVRKSVRMDFTEWVALRFAVAWMVVNVIMSLSNFFICESLNNFNHKFQYEPYNWVDDCKLNVLSINLNQAKVKRVPAKICVRCDKVTGYVLRVPQQWLQQWQNFNKNHNIFCFTQSSFEIFTC